MEDGAVAGRHLPVGFGAEAVHRRNRRSLLEAERTSCVVVPRSFPVSEQNTKAWVMHEYHLNADPL
ncbi:Sulfhydryl oxidase [Psidium guajava]|nr:Sulfhydryl oxidase [Psidium guajava]